MIVGVTGHRPDKLGGYTNVAAHCRVQIAIREALKGLGATKGISGMALGVDTLFTKACVILNIPFIAAVPFAGQERVWNQESQKEYNQLLELAEEVVTVCEGGYASWKMQKRNQWTVDHCDVLLGVWDGTAGGTCNCLRYAERVSKPMYLIRIQTIDGELHAGQYHRVIGIEDTQRQQAKDI